MMKVAVASQKLEKENKRFEKAFSMSAGVPYLTPGGIAAGHRRSSKTLFVFSLLGLRRLIGPIQLQQNSISKTNAVGGERAKNPPKIEGVPRYVPMTVLAKRKVYAEPSQMRETRKRAALGKHCHEYNGPETLAARGRKTTEENLPKMAKANG